MVGICWLYAASLVGFIIVRASLPDLPPFLALVNSFTPFLFAPVPVVLLVALWLRSRRALTAGMIVLILFIGLYGDLFLPRFGRSACEPGRELRVMTFNLGLHLGAPEELMALIDQQGADIVVVQEMTSDMAQRFDQELGSIYPYRVLNPSMETTGLLSRYLVLEEEWIEPIEGGRPYLRAVVEWDNEDVTVFVVHPLPPGLEWYRDMAIPIGLHDAGPQRQVEEVTRRAIAEEGPVLIVGDFNMSDQTRGYANIAEEFRDAYREAGRGFGFTFPKGLRVGDMRVPGPFTRVDYIFHSQSFCARRAQVGCGGGSDHCYVAAGLVRENP
jgi:vancomycin resistance protein VanJ